MCIDFVLGSTYKQIAFTFGVGKPVWRGWRNPELSVMVTAKGEEEVGNWDLYNYDDGGGVL